MGNPHPNLNGFAAVVGGKLSVAAHVSASGPTLTGYRLVSWVPGNYEESGDATEAERDSVVAAAAQGFNAFNAACATAWGAWWNARTMTEKQDWHAAHAGTAFRLRRHHVSTLDASDPVDATTRAALETAAQQSFAAFDSAAAAEWGSWWTSWSQADREGWHVAVKAA